MSLGDSYAGGTGWTYTYTTANGTGTKTTTFGITIPSCGGYGSPGDAQYDQCKTNINNFNIDSIVDSLFIASPVSFNIFPLIGDNNGDPHVQNAIEQGKNSAADFSGHYKIVSIGCGTECASSALYDKSTGTISRFDYTMFIGALGTESYPEFPVIGHSASSDILTLNKKAADNSVYVEKWKFSGGVFIKI
jgi:hypothetical protein